MALSAGAPSRYGFSGRRLCLELAMVVRQAQGEASVIPGTSGCRFVDIAGETLHLPPVAETAGVARLEAARGR